MRYASILALAAFALGAVGCDGAYRFDETSADGGDDGGVLPADDAGEGSGTISGSVGGRTFDHVSSALWLESADEQADVAVYLFENPVQCQTVSMPGWEGHLAAGGQVLELAYHGTQLGTFTVSDDLFPPPGTASVEYIPEADERREILSTGGMLTLDALVPRVHAAGTFDVQLGTTSLRGSFDAVFCPGGGGTEH